jgi:hypothetical protein
MLPPLRGSQELQGPTEGPLVSSVRLEPWAPACAGVTFEGAAGDSLQAVSLGRQQVGDLGLIVAVTQSIMARSMRSRVLREAERSPLNL